MIYEWKSGSHHKVSAQTAGEECEKLEATVGLTPQNLVEASRDESAPMHNEFEWDDAIAGEKWRENQARNVIMTLAVSTDTVPTPEPVRAFYTVENNNYESITVVFTDQDKTDTVLMRAKSELKSFKAKYSMLKELAPIFEAIDKIGG